jgi:Ca2+-binding EF-hand superfamily protein
MKKAQVKAGIILGIATCLFSINTHAQSRDNNQQRKTPPTFSELLKEMDKNEDGKLSKDEVKGPLKDDFAKIDTNEDGFITEKELKNAPKPKRKER